MHSKPCGLLNVDGYYDPLLALFDHAVTEGFLHPGHRGLILEEQDPYQLLSLLSNYRAPALHKWLDRNVT